MRILLCLSLLIGSTGFMPAPASAQIFPAGWEEMRQDFAEKALIKKFYSAFQSGDGKTMAAAYHPDATFNDPVFGTLKGREIGAMWQMLLEISKGNLAIEFCNVDVKADKGKAHWNADYHFSATGLPVHNSIDAEFTFKDGLIYTHNDHFDLHRWSSQALGVAGWLFGNTPFMQNTLREKARGQLQEWLKANP
jgi:ketosteroid isomerase-like protein